MRRSAILLCLLLGLFARPLLADQNNTPIPVQQPNSAPFESEIVAFEAADQKIPPPQGAVVFVGSSSIRLWTTLAKDFPELTVINRGFGGSEIADSIRYAPRIIIPYKPKMIVMYAGGNDINAGKSPAQVLKDFQTLATEIHAALPDTHLVYISMNPAVSRWSKEDQFVEANRLIDKFVHSRQGRAAHLSFIDTHSHLLRDKGEARPEILRADGLHLNSAGYALWASLLRRPILAQAARLGLTQNKP